MILFDIKNIFSNSYISITHGMRFLKEIFDLAFMRLASKIFT